MTLACLFFEILFELCQGFRHIFARKTQPEMITGVVIHGARQQQDTRFTHQSVAELLHFLPEETRERDRSGCGADPLETVSMRRKECIQPGKVPVDDPQVAGAADRRGNSQ